jgi:3-oxoacyl-[acyl-carrier protein] reductase
MGGFLKDKTALIAGCNRGIGKEILTLFAQEGANLVACIRKENPEFSTYIRDLSSKTNVSIEPLYFDMSNEESIKSAINPLIKSKTKIDVLVNNAGVAHGGFLQMTSISKIREVFEVNFFSQLLVIQLVSKLMMRQKTGSIVNLASIAGIDSYPGYSAYGSSKAALIYATKTLSKELARYNIRVNTIAPGMTDTNMAKEMGEAANSEILNRCAMNRLAKPEEIAQLALFLASDQSSFITGQTIRIDGGV